MNPTDQQPDSNPSTDDCANTINNAVENPVADNSAEVSRAKKWDKILNILLLVVLFVLVATLVVKAFFVTNVQVSGDSMFPTYTSGNTVKVSRNATENNVNRGDVVVFYRNKPTWFAQYFDFLIPRSQQDETQNKLLIKRVVATQGDKIWVEELENGKYKLCILTPQGERVFENYVDENGPLEQSAFDITKSTLKNLANHTQSDPYILPQGYFFAMGDNRDISYDSRDFGNVPYENLFGRVI